MCTKLRVEKRWGAGWPELEIPIVFHVIHAGELGLLSTMVPEAYGGLGLDCKYATTPGKFQEVKASPLNSRNQGPNENRS